MQRSSSLFSFFLMSIFILLLLKSGMSGAWEDRLRWVLEKFFSIEKTSSLFNDVVRYMYQPADPQSLGVCRMLFGLLMMLDGPAERGGAELKDRWSDSTTCHFPLLDAPALSLASVSLLYGIMWIGAVGIALGYKFRTTSVMFAAPYWYILLLDKSFWNNHSYLFGLIGTLLIGTQANNYMSLDALFDNSIYKKPVPTWNYFILKFQFFMMYFVAGLKKFNVEWLSGYTMTDISLHWVLAPFRWLIGGPLTDLFVIHWFACFFDLSAGFLLLGADPRTRPSVMPLTIAFHLMNSRLFSIGMFPWVCLATTPLFFDNDWPEHVHRFLTNLHRSFRCFQKQHQEKLKENQNGQLFPEDESEMRKELGLQIKSKSELELNKESCVEDESMLDSELKSKENFNNEEVENLKEETVKEDSTSGLNMVMKQKIEDDDERCGWKRKFVVVMLLIYMFMQTFLPYSHFITQGYNTWTDGPYGYSWDMMVHRWVPGPLVITAVQADGRQLFLDPKAWTINDRWSRQPDMVIQYARCVKSRLDSLGFHIRELHVDVWTSLNGRPRQRLWDPKADLLEAGGWSAWSRWKALMPLIPSARSRIHKLEEHVKTWGKQAQVIFIADFPGLEQNSWLSEDLSNISLTVLEGEILVKNKNIGRAHLRSGARINLKSSDHHSVFVLPPNPAHYMYTFVNKTVSVPQIKGPERTVLKDFYATLHEFVVFFITLVEAILELVLGIPMIDNIAKVPTRNLTTNIAN